MVIMAILICLHTASLRRQGHVVSTVESWHRHGAARIGLRTGPLDVEDVDERLARQLPTRLNYWNLQRRLILTQYMSG